MIVALCVLVAIVLNGMFVRTDYTIDGVDISRLSAAATTEKLGSSKLVSTTHIGPWIDLPGLEISNPVFPATAAVLLLIVYGPGLVWRAAKRLPVRLSVTAVLVFAMFLGLQYGGAYRV